MQSKPLNLKPQNIFHRVKAVAILTIITVVVIMTIKVCRAILVTIMLIKART